MTLFGELLSVLAGGGGMTGFERTRHRQHCGGPGDDSPVIALHCRAPDGGTATTLSLFVTRRLVLAAATAPTRRIDVDITAAVDCRSRSVRVALDYCDLAVWSDDRDLSRFAKDDIAASVNIRSL